MGYPRTPIFPTRDIVCNRCGKGFIAKTTRKIFCDRCLGEKNNEQIKARYFAQKAKPN